MNLIVKHTEGKLPFIGVLYSGKDEAAKAFPVNIEKVTLSVNENYGRISLSLYQGDSRLLFHRLIEYDHKEYRAWRAYAHLGINYGHCYKENGQIKVARDAEGKALIINLIILLNHKPNVLYSNK